jgi:dTDP-4-amino-4,6-dideoxygalactose transaminase
MNMDPEKIEAALTPATRAIVPVHLYGRPAELDEIHSVAARHGLTVVEDAAQAHGARYRGRRIGAHSQLVTWSFYPGKNLGALGDGGAVTTDDAEVAERLRLLRNYGSRRKYEHLEPGLNSRLDALQAAVLRVKLCHLDGWNARRAALAKVYTAALADLGIVMPATRPHVEPCWHLFAIRHPQRDELQRHLTREGIETVIHYPRPCHLQPAYAHLRGRMLNLAATERLSAEVLSLPMGPHLGDDQVVRVLDAVRSFCRCSATV